MQSKINAKTGLLGIIGNPIAHSLSPLMHNYLLETLELDFVYLAFDLKTSFLEEGVKGLVSLGAKGFNVTVPHKEAVINYLDHVEKSAKLIGAVNTVLIKEGKTYGYNTDITGFKESIDRTGLSLKGKNVSVLGAGGAARAAIIGLLELGASKVNIINRNKEKTSQLIDSYQTQGIKNLNNILVEQGEEAINNSTLIVNATPVGMKGYLPGESPIPSDFLHEGMWVCDLVYNPLETVLLAEATQKGCQVIDGLEMLVQQGADAFKIWTGVHPPRDKMRNLLIEHI